MVQTDRIQKVTRDAMAKDSEACTPDVCLPWAGRKTGFSCVPSVRAAQLFQLRKADAELSKTLCKKVLQPQQIHWKGSTSGTVTLSARPLFLVCIDYSKYLVYNMHLINNKDLSHPELHGIAHCCAMITSTCPLFRKRSPRRFPMLLHLMI